MITIVPPREDGIAGTVTQTWGTSALRNGYKILMEYEDSEIVFYNKRTAKG